MATTTINVKNNFASVFSAYTNENEIKSIANAIGQELKKSVEARLAELAGGKATATVEVNVSVQSEATSKPTATTKKDATAKAKEVAARLKETQKAKPEPKAKAEPKVKSESEDDTLISITDKDAIAKLGLTFVKYTDKCYALYGDTKPLRNELKKLGGTFNKYLKVGEGWVFRNKQVPEIEKALGIKAKEVA